MPRASAPAEPTAKELRRQAKNAGVRGWEEMSREELIAAIDGSDEDAEDEDTEAEAEEEAPRTRTRAKKATVAAKAAPARATRTRAAKTAPAKAAVAKKTAPAKKSTAAKKAAPRPRAAEAEGPNPFRPKTNLWYFAEALMKGGKRSVLVARLLPKVSYSPRVQSEADFDKEKETDRRLKAIGYILRNKHGFTYEHDGRGPDAFIKATPPDA